MDSDDNELDRWGKEALDYHRAQDRLTHDHHMVTEATVHSEEDRDMTNRERKRHSSYSELKHLLFNSLHFSLYRIRFSESIQLCTFISLSCETAGRAEVCFQSLDGIRITSILTQGHRSSSGECNKYLNLSCMMSRMKFG